MSRCHKLEVERFYQTLLHTHKLEVETQVLSNTTTHSQTRGREVPSDKISILPA